MVELHEWLARGDFDAEFFSELSNKGLGRRFSVGNFTAGKFPKPVERPVAQSLCNQYAAGRIAQNSCGDMKLVHCGG